MRFSRTLGLLLAALFIPICALSEAPVVGPSTFTFTAGSQSNTWTCNGGQSTFQLTVPSGLSGTFTVTVGQTSGTATNAPPWAFAPGSASNVNTITNSGTLTVILGTNAYVKVADTSYSSGSVTVIGSCSGASAALPPSSGSVTSVTASLPFLSSGGFAPNISASPQAANSVFAGPTSGATAGPTFRNLVAADIPSLPASIITSGVLGITNGGTGSATQNFVDLSTTQNVAGAKTFTSNLSAVSVLPAALPTPNSSSTIVVFGDSLTYGAYGPTSCVSAANQPSSVASGSLTGTCWADAIGSHYGAHVINLGVGGSPLTNVGPGGDGAGVLRYSAPYVCPTPQTSSPTSGIDENCNAGVSIPALDSQVSSSTFLVIGYFGHNDNFYTWGNSAYSTYLANLQTIVNDAISHGQVANKIIFLGSMKGNNGNEINQYQYADLITSKANAYEAAILGARYVDLTTPLATSFVSNSGNAVYYDSIHPNDSTNCSGSGCLGGSAIIATAIESPADLSASFYAAALGIAGELTINTTGPFLDSNGNLTLPSGFCLEAGSSSFCPTAATVNGILTANTGVSLPANPGGGTAATLNDYEKDTWVPADASGAGLTITNNETAIYTKIGRMACVSLDISYPSTGSGSTAAITLPFTAMGPSSGVPFAPLSVTVLNAPSSSVTPTVNGADSPSDIKFWSVGGNTQEPNSVLSNSRLFINGCYTTSV